MSNGSSAARSSSATGCPGPDPGTISTSRSSPGDNSNTQYALLGLNAASEAGVSVKPEVWALSRAYFEAVPESRRRLGLHAQAQAIDRQHDLRGDLQPDPHGLEAVSRVSNTSRARPSTIAAKAGFNASLARGIDWLANHFDVKQNFGNGQQWKYYYLYALERAGRLAGVRFFGPERLVSPGRRGDRQRSEQALRVLARGGQENELVATSFALLFLAKGRAPVLINKLAPPS